MLINLFIKTLTCTIRRKSIKPSCYKLLRLCGQDDKTLHSQKLLTNKLKPVTIRMTLENLSFHIFDVFTVNDMF